MSDLITLIKRIEVVLFLENQLVIDKRLAAITRVPIKELPSYVDKLNELYQKSGSVLSVKKLNDSYQLYVGNDYKDEVLSQYKSKRKKLSRALLETLAIIAYKQPIAKVEVDVIRGVNCHNHIKQLFEDGFIMTAGKKNAVGKPNVYRTTDKFLIHFGLNSLKDLPSLKDVKTYDFLEVKPI